MSEVLGSFCRVPALRSKRARKSLMMAAASAAMAVTAAHANTEQDVPDGTPDLSTLSPTPTSTTDLTFTSTTYNTTNYTTGGTVLTLGTLDDLDGTQDLIIADPSGAITLNGGSNSLSALPGSLVASTDALYVASGGTLDLSGVSLTLNPTSATLDVAGVLNLGTWTSAAGSTYTFTGGGTTNAGTLNTATFLGSLNVSSGTLVNNAAGAYGTGTITLGAASGSANATLVAGGTVSFTNPIVVQSGSTGILRLTGSNPLVNPTFTGNIAVNNYVTLGNGGTSTAGANFSGIISGSVTAATTPYVGGITVDAGASTISLTGSNTYTGTISLASGTLLLGNSSSLGSGTLVLGAYGSSDTGTLLVANGLAKYIYAAPNDSGRLQIEAPGVGSYGINGGTIFLGVGSVAVGSIPAATPEALTVGQGSMTTTGGLQELELGEIAGNGTLNVDAGTYSTTTGTGGTTTTGPNIILLDKAILTTAHNGGTFSINVISGELSDVSSGEIGSFNTVSIGSAGTLDIEKSQVAAGLQDLTLNGMTTTGVLTNNSAGSGIGLSVGGTVPGATYTFSGSFVNGTGGGFTLGSTSSFADTQIIQGDKTIFYGSQTGAQNGFNISVASLGGTLLFNGNDTFAGAISAGGGTVNLPAGYTDIFDGPVNAGLIETSIGTAALSGGTLILNGTYTFSGTNVYGNPSNGATITDGTLSTNSLANVANTSGTVYIGFTQPSGTGGPPPATAYSGTLRYTGPTATTSLIFTGSPANPSYSTYASFYANPALGNLSMAGSGTLTLTGQSTYAGTTTLAGGTLDLGTAENAGTSGPIGNGGTVSFAGGTLQYSSVNQYDYSSRFSTAAGQKYNVDTNGQAITFASPLTSSTGNLTVSDSVGTGSLLLSGSNSFSGAVTVKTGDLVLGNASALGAPLFSNTGTSTYSLGKASTTVSAGALDLNGNSVSGLQVNLTGTGNSSTGALINSGGAATLGVGSGIGTFLVSNVGSGQTSTNGSATVSATGVTGFAATGSIGVASVTGTAGSGYYSAGTVSVSGGGGTGLTVSAALTASGGIVFAVTNPGTGYTSIPMFTLNNPLGGSGAAITGATLGLTGVTVTSFGTASAGYSLSNLPTLTVSGSGLTTNAAITVNPVVVSLSGSATIGGTGNITINDPITQTAGQNYGITKSGSNTLTLNCASNYTGATNINSGTLAGTGTITSAVSIAAGATISPGIGTGGNTLTTGAVTGNGTSGGSQSTASNFSFAINTTAATSDELVSTGAVTLGSNSLLSLTEIGTSTVAASTTFVLIQASSLSGAFSNFANNSQLTTPYNTYTIEYGPTGYANDLVAIANATTSTPEPGSLSILGIGGIVLLRRRRHVSGVSAKRSSSVTE